MSETTVKPKIQLSLTALKYIAIIAMLIDHIAYAFVDQSSSFFQSLDFIGRTTGPIMFFAAVEGYHHTKNLKKYISRLALCAATSYLPFMYLFEGGFNPLAFNVIFTITFGILAIHVRRTIKNSVLKYILSFALMILCIKADYYILGFLIIQVFDIYYDNKKYQLIAYLLVFSTVTGMLSSINAFFYYWISGMGMNTSYLTSQFSNFGFFVPLFLLSTYNGELGGSGSKYSKWFFYIFYPAHLTILLLLQKLISS